MTKQTLFGQIDEISSGRRGCVAFTLKSAKAVGLTVDDVTDYAEDRGCVVSNLAGSHGHIVSKSEWEAQDWEAVDRAAGLIK